MGWGGELDVVLRMGKGSGVVQRLYGGEQRGMGKGDGRIQRAGHRCSHGELWKKERKERNRDQLDTR